MENCRLFDEIALFCEYVACRIEEKFLNGESPFFHDTDLTGDMKDWWLSTTEEMRGAVEDLFNVKGYKAHTSLTNYSLEVYPKWLVSETPPKDPDRFFEWLHHNFGIGLVNYTEELRDELFELLYLFCKIGKYGQEGNALIKLLNEINTWSYDEIEMLEERLSEIINQ